MEPISPVSPQAAAGAPLRTDEPKKTPKERGVPPGKTPEERDAPVKTPEERGFPVKTPEERDLPPDDGPVERDGPAKTPEERGLGLGPIRSDLASGGGDAGGAEDGPIHRGVSVNGHQDAAGPGR